MIDIINACTCASRLSDRHRIGDGLRQATRRGVVVLATAVRLQQGGRVAAVPAG